MLLSADDTNTADGRGGCEAQAPMVSSEGSLGKHPNPHLFEVSVLDQLHSFLCILQVHSLAHAGLGMGRGQPNQGFQGPGCNWGGLGEKTRMPYPELHIFFKHTHHSHHTDKEIMTPPKKL